MTVYHGSEFVVEKPLHGLGKRTNDYGLGFYCTEDKTLAGEWSVSPLHDGFVNQYEKVLSRQVDDFLGGLDAWESRVVLGL